MSATVKVLRFRVSGVLPNWNTAYLTGTVAQDAPEHIVSSLQDTVREAFAEKYPAAIHVQERTWIEDVDTA